MTSLRLVRVFIIDPDSDAWENALDAVVFDSKEVWTFSDDDSVLLELDAVGQHIITHNAKRRETVDPVAARNSGNSEARLLPLKISQFHTRVVPLVTIP